MKRGIALALLVTCLSCKTSHFKGGVARSQQNEAQTPNGTDATPETETPTDPITGKPIGENPGGNQPGDPDGPGGTETPTTDPNDPFVEITKLGVNFEDRPGTDDDYNDAVLCFKGAFKINSKQLISLKKQDLIATTSSISLCKHNIEVKIFDRNKKLTSSKTYDTKTKNEVKMQLLEGDELEINMIPYEGCGVGQVRSMRDGRFAKILRDECRTTGK